MKAQTIDEVIAHLDAIIERSRRDRSRLGFFAVLYRNVTARVRAGLHTGRFDDAERMERLDVTFANRYLEALDRYRQGKEPTACWQLAFEATDRWSAIILQHLLLGMNAHINLDLGIAAARTCPGNELADLERDFNEINAILLAMLDATQDRISRVSPWLGLLDWAGGRTDETIAGFGLKGARERAWLAARRLAPLPPERQAPVIHRLDRTATALGRLILRPGVVLSSALRIIRVAERKPVPDVMDALA